MKQNNCSLERAEKQGVTVLQERASGMTISNSHNPDQHQIKILNNNITARFQRLTTPGFSHDPKQSQCSDS